MSQFNIELMSFQKYLGGEFSLWPRIFYTDHQFCTWFQHLISNRLMKFVIMGCESAKKIGVLFEHVPPTSIINYPRIKILL